VAALAAQLQEEQGEEKMTDEEEREVIDKKHEEMLEALRDLIDALPDRLEMAVAAFMEGKTVVEAKAAMADDLLAELADKSAKLEAAAKPTAELRAQVAAELAAEQRQPVTATIDAAPAAVLDVRGQWDAALNAHLSAGLSRPDAVAQIVRKNPTLHREFIAAANNGLKG
jgi:chromosome segregation ATPase